MAKSLIRMTAAAGAASLVLTLSVSLSGCGLAETGVAAAAGGVSKAEEAKQAQQTEARLQKKIDEAYKTAADRRNAADADSQ